MVSPSLKLDYYAVRGRGEPIRLLLSYLEVEFEEVETNVEEMKAEAGTSRYPFGQSPVLIDGSLEVAQSDAILRHFGRKYNCYGQSMDDATRIDMVLLGVEEIRRAYYSLIYDGRLSPEAKAAYFTKHIDPKTSQNTQNNGAHFTYLSNILQRNNGGNGVVVGDVISIADMQLYEIVDLHLREAAYPTEFKAAHPLLVAHHDRIASIPSIRKYISSDRCFPKVTGLGLG